MENLSAISIAILVLFLMLAGGFAFYILLKIGELQKKLPPPGTIEAMSEKLLLAEQSSRQSFESFSELIASKFQALENSSTERFSTIEKFNRQVLHDFSSSVTDRLQSVEQNSRQSFEGLAQNLGKLKSDVEGIREVAKSIASLEDLLKPPKLRGGMGETLLSELLNQILPSKYFSFQHSFKSGQRVDAVIHLGAHILSVDAKFPLENFRKLQSAVNGQDAKTAGQLRKLFINDVKTHIEKISSQYILPQERTYDFALMYIPAENVYYEAIIKDDLGEGLFPFSLEKRVIPVSPNSFYAYLEVILRGLRGFQVEERAQEILSDLSKLQKDTQKFREEFDILGRHMANANAKFNEADKSFGKIENNLKLIERESTSPTSLPAP